MTNEELVQQYKSGDYTALDELITRNKRLIYMVAKQFEVRCNFISLEDLTQEAWFGFFKAIEKYDPNHQNAAKFSTYAIYWIRQVIQRYLKQKTPKIKESSLQQPLTEDGLTYEDVLEADEEDVREMWHRLEIRELHIELEDALSKYLTLQQRQTIEMHYGWDGTKESTFEDISILFDVSRTRAAQIHNEAMRRLRQTKWARLRAMERLAVRRIAVEYDNPVRTLLVNSDDHMMKKRRRRELIMKQIGPLESLF